MSWAVLAYGRHVISCSPMLLCQFPVQVHRLPQTVRVRGVCGALHGVHRQPLAAHRHRRQQLREVAQRYHPRRRTAELHPPHLHSHGRLMPLSPRCGEAGRHHHRRRGPLRPDPILPCQQPGHHHGRRQAGRHHLPAPHADALGQQQSADHRTQASGMRARAAGRVRPVHALRESHCLRRRRPAALAHQHPLEQVQHGAAHHQGGREVGVLPKDVAAVVSPLRQAA
mmetsp:Transcript_1783/g.4404  ORF Transcript_1783/g.4404 Transcript_1783/m.4404 type:complete len:226 (+) Transcript_1783:347-1024(+)